MKSLWLVILCCGAGFACTASARITQGFVAGADHVKIHYREDGPQNAPRSLLLIPGWRVSSLIWAAQLRYFAARGDRVVAIDSRSQGGSTVVYRHNSPEDRAQDIHEVIEHLHLAHVTLVGWSQGVQDVAAYVNRFGAGGLEDLALIDAPLSGGPGQAARNPGFLTTILRGIASYSRDPRGYSQGMMRAIISVPIPSALMRRLVGESMKTPVDVGISMLVQDLFTVDRRSDLEKFTRPTLVVAARRSPLLAAERRMAAHLPMGQFVVIRHAAHALFFDRPAKFDSTLEAFITRVAANRGARS